MGVSKTSDGRYYVYYQFRSKQRKEYFGKSPQDKAAAEQKDLFLKLLKKQGKKVFEDFINNEIREKKSTTDPTSDSPQEVYLDYLGQQYVNNLKRKNSSYAHLFKIQHLLNKYVLPVYSKNAKPVDQLTYLEVISWFDNYTEANGYSPLTRRGMISIMKAMFNFGISTKLTTNNPIASEKTPINYKLKFELTLEDLRKIIQHAAPHIAWAIEVGYETAARFGPTELFNLQWKDVDFENNTIHIRGTKTETSDRYVPITQKFSEKLLQVKNEGLLIVVSRRRGPIYRKHPTHIISYKNTVIDRNITNGFKSACRRAGITYNVRPYDIRHLSISQMLASGGNLKAISEIAGHSSISTTARYLHTLKNEKERSVNQREAL